MSILSERSAFNNASNEDKEVGFIKMIETTNRADVTLVVHTMVCTTC